MPASISPVLPESERSRLLGLLGFSRWQRRGSIVAAARSPAQRVPAPVPGTPTTARTPPVHLPAPALRSEPAPARVAPPPLRATDLCLLVLAERRHADAPLVKALARLLPGVTICTAESATALKARFAVTLGSAPLTLPGVLAISAPPLDELRSGSVAKRRLWWALKPLLRELGR